MTTFISPRLRKPAVVALGGALFAAAWLIRGGPLWWVSIMSVVVTAVRIITMYRMGGKDTDEGALAASRADERQQLLSVRSRALGFNVTAITAFVGLTVTIALNSAATWPFVIIIGALVLGYLFGLSNYGGDDEENPADSDDNSRRTPSPVT